MTSIDKTYQPQSIETYWYQQWEKNGYFSPHGEGEPYCIMLPPPNVTGSLHMGHGFGYTLMDILIRYHRMCGQKTLWQPGTDHAGIATQMVVERQLNRRNQDRISLGREKFIDAVWTWKHESGHTITKQFRRLGTSMDWTREKFTLDEDLSHAVHEVFIRLYKEGLIYRGTRLVNWDPALQTAISDLEVINQEEEGKLWTIRYPLVDSNEYIMVATTRPETMFGDAAVAVHPDDQRYKHLAGRKVLLPLTDRVIPIIADEYVDREFGTGCVKITPAHDFNDYEVGKRHGLTLINIFTTSAHLNREVPKMFRGMDRQTARAKVLQQLEKENLIAKTKKHILKIPKAEKSGAIVEPFLTEQWFLKMQSLAEPAKRAVKNGDIQFVPSNWDKTYFQWMDNIQDWCISRQLWWGHRIPIWYDEKGNQYAGLNAQDVRKSHQLSDDTSLKQDEDVLDTWFSAAIWPFSTLGWPLQTEELKTFFPTNVLVTGFDIIFFWVARMIMMSLKFTKQVPFKEVYITGLIRDSEGQKMSKSKGNVLDPIDLIDGISLEDLIEKRCYGLMQESKKDKIKNETRQHFPEGIASFGTDALRFTFCSLASHTREIRFDMNRLSGNRNFCNKLWNASRYILMNISEDKTVYSNRIEPQSTVNLWVLSQLQIMITEAHLALKQYRFDWFAQILYDFTWNEFCDWYLELSKSILNDKDHDLFIHETKHTLVFVLESLLRLLHPIIPFITEEIWQRFKPFFEVKVDSIMLAAYPEANRKLIHKESCEVIDWIKQIVIAIRSVRSEMVVSPGKKISILLKNGSSKDRDYFNQYQNLIFNLAKLQSVEWLKANDHPPKSASAFVGKLEIYIPLEGLINLQEELARLEKEKLKLKKDWAMIEKKLNNPNFTQKAPREVVAKEKHRLDEIVSKLQKIDGQIKELGK